MTRVLPFAKGRVERGFPSYFPVKVEIQSFNNVKRNTRKYWTPTYAGEKFPSLFL
jgi:hypothetical protein